MMKREIEFLAMTSISLLIIFLCAKDAFGAERIAVGDEVPNFILQDADDNVYEPVRMKGNMVILLMGTRELRGENRQWAAALKETFATKDSVKILMVADMRGIPFFLSKEFIKGRIRSDKQPVPLLLDWDQKVNQLLGTEEGKINIFVIGSDGLVLHHETCINYSEEGYSKLQAKIEEFLINNKRRPYDGQTNNH